MMRTHCTIFITCLLVLMTAISCHSKDKNKDRVAFHTQVDTSYKQLTVFTYPMDSLMDDRSLLHDKLELKQQLYDLTVQHHQSGAYFTRVHNYLESMSDDVYKKYRIYYRPTFAYCGFEGITLFFVNKDTDETKLGVTFLVTGETTILR